MDTSKIKLIIWDLDDTFWHGTLTEGGIAANEGHIKLVKDLTDRGIVNSICSKNDKEPVMAELSRLGVADLFVFSSVDWTPKGPRISAMLKDMGLRAVNVLFLDDNIVNLNEAIHYEPNLMTETPDAIPQLIEWIKTTPVSDATHKRLNNYKVLEQKQNSRNAYSDNESFLFASNTRVSIQHDCLEQLDRIHELILRTNQLNFTKNRSSKEELEELLHDSDVQSGYVKVKDAFGDYGIVGFYAVKNNKCIHFLFSCRTIGQGVEQYVYASIGYPELEVEGVVINQVNHEPAPGWINQCVEKADNIMTKAKGKIVFKGPCDLMGLTSYLKADNLICELTYISDTRHNNMEHQGCMTNYLQIPTLKEADIRYLVDDLIFNDEKMFSTSIFDNDAKLIFISSLQEFHFGIYRHRTKGYKICFGEWNHPMTDTNEWEGYIHNKVWTSSNKFTREFLEDFSKDWEFVGRKSYDEYEAEVRQFMGMVASDAHVCIFLGSEIPYEGETPDAWKNRHIVHKDVNDRLRKIAKEFPRLHLIDYTDFITSNKDYTDSIDHFQRYVHYKIAQSANNIIEDVLGAKIQQSGKIKIYKNKFRDFLTSIHIALIGIKKKLK